MQVIVVYWRLEANVTRHGLAKQACSSYCFGVVERIEVK
jgi:hypothetical protein